MKRYLLFILLFVLAVGSTAVLGNQERMIVAQTDTAVIALDPAQEGDVEIVHLPTSTAAAEADADAASQASSASQTQITEADIAAAETYAYTTANGDFTVTSNQTLWQQTTDLEIFNGQDMVAPGDSGSFLYTLSNGKDGVIEYNMTVNTSSTGDYDIPLTFRLKTADGTYVNGSDAWLQGDALEKVVASVAANTTASYILEWQWDANESDAYDLLLAADQDAQYTVVISITAFGDLTTDSSIAIFSGLPIFGDSISTAIALATPKTGEAMLITLVLAAAAVVFVAILLLLFIPAKQKKDANEEPSKTNG